MPDIGSMAALDGQLREAASRRAGAMSGFLRGLKKGKEGSTSRVSDASTVQAKGAPGQSLLHDERVDKILTRQKRFVYYVQTCTFACLVMVIGVLLGFVIYLGHMLMGSYRHDVPLSGLSKEIRYRDEVLTASVRMAAFTGDRSWEDRYNENVDPILYCISEVQRLAPVIADRFTALSGVANEKLIDLEAQTFDMSRYNTTAAISIVMGPTYKYYKTQLSDGLLLLDESIGHKVHNAYTNAQSFTQSAAISTGLISFVAVVVCAALFYITNRHSQEDKAEIFKIMVRLHNAAAASSHSKDGSKAKRTNSPSPTPRTGGDPPAKGTLQKAAGLSSTSKLSVRLSGTGRVHSEHSASQGSMKCSPKQAQVLSEQATSQSSMDPGTSRLSAAEED